MPSLALDNRLIWFAHCPKAGGTSVEAAMVAIWHGRVGHLDWTWQRRRRRGIPVDMPCSPQHLIWADAIPRLPRTPDAVFALVRDPVMRLESEHRWQRRGREATLLGRFIAFLPFFFWARLMLAMAKNDPYAFDNHLRPQTDFIPDTARIFRLEDGMEALSHWLGQITDRPPIVISPRLKGRRAGRGANGVTRARIEHAFAADFRRFGYPSDTEAPVRDMLDRIAAGLAPHLVRLDRSGWL